MGKFIQIHTLTGFSSVLLNRDDTGMAKRIEYGNNIRTRTSSQFAKRKLRTATTANSLISIKDAGMSIRSRLVFHKKIAEPLIEAGYDKKSVIAVVMSIMGVMYNNNKDLLKKNNKKFKEIIDDMQSDELSVLDKNELVIFGEAEIERIKEIAKNTLDKLDNSILEDDKSDEIILKNMIEYFKDKEISAELRAIPNTSIDMAAFGRMVTGDCLSNMDAAVHVAHAFSVHSQQTEVDFFTAVDDLKNSKDGDDSGSAHVGETEINSPLLYAYYVIDFDALVGNLTGLDNAREVAAEVVNRIIRLASENIVGAKKGSTAPYSSADLIFLEVGEDMPRSLAKAYRKPAAPTLPAAVSALTEYIAGKEKIYSKPDGDRFLMSTVDAEIDGAEKMNLSDSIKCLKNILMDE